MTIHHPMPHDPATLSLWSLDAAEKAGPVSSSKRLLAAARALAPRIRALSDEIEQERRLPPALVAALAEAGLFRMAVPRLYGGADADPLTVAETVEELSKADGSVGWCVSIATQAATCAGFLPESVAAEVFGSPDAVLAGVWRPVGRAIPVDGGYRVAGRWPFASGSSHATWFVGECVIADGDDVRRDRDGTPVTHLLFFPRADCTVHDTWTAVGLCGTASHDFSVEDVFVPGERCYPTYGELPRHPSPRYRDTVLPFLGHGSHALGIAQAAIDAVLALADAKNGVASRALLREQPRFQAQIAEAQALVESARHYLIGAGGELWAAVRAEGEGTAAQRARVRLAIGHAVRSAVQAVDLMYAAAGTGALFAHSPLQRQFRDIHTAAAHVMVGPAAYEAVGRVTLGLDARMPFF